MVTRVSGLYRVGLLAPNVDDVSRFYEQTWRMEPLQSSGQEHIFRSSGVDHGDLLVRKGDAGGLDHIALSVRSEADLETILASVSAAGGNIIELPHPGRYPGEAMVAAIHDLDGNRIELVVPSSEGRPEPLSGVSPRRLGHVVLWSPRVAEQEAFYGLLGFRVSDRTHIGMSFLRCNADHHSLAITSNQIGRTGLQHVAFDVGTIDEVMREFGRLTQSGVQCIWGVGRHGPGNNVFSYYRDPAGNVVEFYGEMETFGDEAEVETRHWGPEHKGDIWGVAGPPPSAFRD